MSPCFPLLLAVSGLFLGAAPVRAAVDYLKGVKPLLQERCYSCHGALKQKGGLRLDTAALLRQGGESGDALSMGADGKSLLVQRVSSTDPEEHMPPQHEGERFTAAQIAILSEWIASGAPAPADEKPEADPREHWSFRPRQRPRVPAAAPGGWGRNTIDAFLAQGYASGGVRPLAEAPPEVLLRRLFLDLVGVPPTLEEIAAVEEAPGSDWYPAAVERLLADPRHGQRWGRHWMDIWRYSDWWGLGAQLRNSQKHLWHWRDWIVEALNADTPYDEMVRLMLAADEIAPADPQKLRATGFLARNWFLFNRNSWMEETVEHVGKGFLGLTFNCAKCHDHKYDPLSQADFYKMRAFFEPYQVRLDVVPGETNLERDGIPRAFDGLLDAPTFRFVRGEESNADKSVLILPEVPTILSQGTIVITPVVLPLLASQPERQPWVLDAHLEGAQKALIEAEAALAKLGEKKALVEKKGTAGGEVSPSVAGQPAAQSGADAALWLDRAEVEEAMCAVDFAKADLRSMKVRAEAMRAQWENFPHEQELKSAAIRAEREAVFARELHTLAEARGRVLRANVDKKPAMEKQVKTAEEAVAKASKALAAPIEAADSYSLLYGAKWTPTRFLSSAKDDPVVPFPKVSTGRRKALAEWITDPRNPLAARVAVNHLWARHLGTPLAANTFDFGRKGSPPTHPELLDWLASELVESGWSMKHLHRLIVTSAAYRMSSSLAGAEDALAKDPDNRRLWRRTPLRLEAEAVRDSILALAGELDCAEGGASIPAAAQNKSKRRSLYFYHSNNERNLFLTTFDEAAVKECYRRDESIVPQQALALTNSSLVHDAAVRIGVLLFKPGSAPGASEEESFVRNAYSYILGIKAKPEEVAACSRAMEAWRRTAPSGETNASALARTNLVWALLNHNDFVTLR
ncbi:MAG: Protein of unknown function (DUF1553)/Planctomycete cytochrome C [Verrucomicrobia bacterium]|nr:MAG: Protein of unknown function (DUF1553)/Planctomycete cytochrome C [Verrucomicrobiota bacterium]